MSEPSELGAPLDHVYETNERNEVFEEYWVRHGIHSAGILTVTTDETVDYLRVWRAPRCGGGLCFCQAALGVTGW